MPNRRIEEVFKGHPLIHLPPSATVREAAKVMADKHVAAVAVTNPAGGPLEGIFTERDLIERVVAKGLDADKVVLSEVMTPRPVTITFDHTVRQALAEMRDNGLRHLPVTQGDRVVGMVSMRDFVGDEVAELDHERDLIKNVWEHMR